MSLELKSEEVLGEEWKKGRGCAGIASRQREACAKALREHGVFKEKKSNGARAEKLLKEGSGRWGFREEGQRGGVKSHRVDRMRNGFGLWP